GCVPRTQFARHLLVGFTPSSLPICDLEKPALRSSIARSRMRSCFLHVMKANLSGGYDSNALFQSVLSMSFGPWGNDDTTNTRPLNWAAIECACSSSRASAHHDGPLPLITAPSALASNNVDRINNSEGISDAAAGSKSFRSEDPSRARSPRAMASATSNG